MDKHVGIIGGMGPDAGVEFFSLLIRKTREMTAASTDQDHIHVTLESNPKVANRNVAICEGEGVKECGDAMEAAARRLKLVECDFAVLVCNTAHYFQPSVIKGLSGTPFLSMIDVCLNNIEAHFAEMKSRSTVGILGGKGCMVGRVYQGALEKRGIEYFVLDEARQDKAMEAIYCVKQGKIGEARTTFKPLLDYMVSQGVKSVILGCTEIPIIIKEDFELPEGVKFFDSCDLLADTVVRVAKGLENLEDVL